MGTVAGLYNLEISRYEFFRCPVCQNIFRWGKYGAVEGILRCPWCGALITSKIKPVDKVSYREWAQRMDILGKTPTDLQRDLWNPTKI
jgi:uncharacterized C2H2 Zn-finger protein